jgi:hypothetical protein
MKFGDVVSDAPAPIIPYADCRMTCPYTRKQKNCGKQTRYELHVPPWFEQTDLIVSRAKPQEPRSSSWLYLGTHPGSSLVRVEQSASVGQQCSWQ